MIELLLCSLFTILPDFLYRRYVQGKRLGREITLYSVWFELRYGITACLGLTILLVTLILYFHPSTSNAISFYRTVPVLPGRIRARRGSLCKRSETRSKAASRYSNLTVRNRRPLSRRRAGVCRKWTQKSLPPRPNWKRRTPASARRRPRISKACRNCKPRSNCATGTRLPCSPREIEKLRDIGRRPRSRCGDGQRKQGNQRSSDLVGSAGPEGERRGSGGAGPGRTGQDGGSRRDRRHVGAIHPAKRRYRQSVDAPGRRPYPIRCRSLGPCCRVSINWKPR